MTLFHRSATHQRIVELEETVRGLEESIAPLQLERDGLIERVKQAERENRELNRRYVGALMAVRVLMLTTKAKPVLVWFSKKEKK